MVTEEVVKNQENSTNPVDSTYVVTVKHGNTESTEKPVLEALLPGVRLHFLRYGLFYKEAKDDTGYRIGGSEDGGTFTTSEMDSSDERLKSTKNFYAAQTSLNKGYLYLFNKDNPSDYHELAVDELGNIAPILWKGDNVMEDGKTPKDVRELVEKEVRYMRVINKKKEEPKSFWILYSPTQFPYEYHQKMLNLSDEEKKKAHFIVVTCGGIKPEEQNAQAHVHCYKDVKLVHYKNHPNHHSIKKTIKQINATEKKENESGKNTRYEDMFITLHDPISCAEDIGMYVEDEFLKMESLLESLETGNDHKIIYSRKRDGKEKTSTSEAEQQVGALFHLAQTTYKLVYDSEKMIRDYDGGNIGWWNTDLKGNGIHKEKLLIILGVAERKEQRNRIITFRDEYGAFLSGAYYKEAWSVYNNLLPDCVIDGQCRLTQHIALLANHPHHLDRHLDLKSHYTGQHDPWESFFYESITEDTTKPINALLDAPVELSALVVLNTDVGRKIGATVRQLVESYAERTVIKMVPQKYTKTISVEKTREVVTSEVLETKTYRDHLVRRVRKHKVYGVHVIDMNIKEVDALFTKKIHEGYRLDKTRLEIKRSDNKGKEKDLYKPREGTKVKTERFQLNNQLVLKEELRPKHRVRGGHTVGFPVIKTEEISKVEIEKYLDKIEKEFTQHVPREVKKFSNADIAEKILDNKMFTGALVGLDILNFISAITQLKKEEKKNYVNLVGVTGELSEALLKHQQNVLLSRGVSSGRVLTRATKFAGGVGNIGTVVICLWEALDSSNARDYDAAWAWGGAAVAWGILSFGGLGFTPPGLIAGGIAIGLTALAYYLKDTPLENFFKNNVLSDAVGFKRISGEEPWEYNLRLYQKRKTLIEDPTLEFFSPNNKREWTNFKVAYEDFMDIIICANIQFSPDKEENPTYTRASGGTVSAKIRLTDIISYQATIDFRQFLSYKEQLEYDIYYYKNGLKGAYECITPVHKETQILNYKDESQAPRAIINFTLPKSMYKDNTEASRLLFVCKLKVEEGHYYPITAEGEQRYLAATFPTKRRKTVISKGLFNTKEINNTDFQPKVKIDTLTNLLQGTS